MSKKRKWGIEESISLHGVSFEEALSGILVVTPPKEVEETKKDGRKKTPAASKGQGDGSVD
jgi:hypothetical protein